MKKIQQILALFIAMHFIPEAMENLYHKKYETQLNNLLKLTETKNMEEFQPILINAFNFLIKKEWKNSLRRVEEMGKEIAKSFSVQNEDNFIVGFHLTFSYYHQLFSDDSSSEPEFDVLDYSSGEDSYASVEDTSEEEISPEEIWKEMGGTNTLCYYYEKLIKEAASEENNEMGIIMVTNYMFKSERSAEEIKLSADKKGLSNTKKWPRQPVEATSIRQGIYIMAMDRKVYVIVDPKSDLERKAFKQQFINLMNRGKAYAVRSSFVGSFIDKVIAFQKGDSEPIIEY